MRANWALAALLPAIGAAQELTIFRNGEAADADAVNANFRALKDQLAIFDARLLQALMDPLNLSQWTATRIQMRLGELWMVSVKMPWCHLSSTGRAP